MDIINVISKLDKLKHLTPASIKDVNEAEKMLKINFSSDFLQYVLEYGVISTKGLSITGISEHPNLSVVYQTVQARKQNDNFPKDMYVIDNTGIEGILILQNEKGEIYEFNNPLGECRKIYSSLSEYIIECTSD